MPVITINGPIGCGSAEIGRIVAEKLKINFVDRLVFTEAAKLVQAPVGALIDKEQRVVRFRDRLGKFVETMLERSAISGGMHPGGAFMTSLPENYASLERDRSTKATTVTDKDFIDATTTVVEDLCRAGDVVIIGRGANVILADTPGVLHVGLIAPLEVRAENLMRWEGIDQEEAEVYVEELERANVMYFRKFFQVHPSEPGLYHTILNMGKLQPETATVMIVQAAEDLESAPQTFDDARDDSELLIGGWGEQGKQ